MNVIAAVVGRILLSIIFIVSGASKLFDPEGTGAMLSSVGLSPSLALPPKKASAVPRGCSKGANVAMRPR